MRKKSKSIFRVLLCPHLFVLLGEIILMMSLVLFSGIYDQLNQNMHDIFQGQIENRHSYLLNEMAGNWSDLQYMTEDINGCVQTYLDGGGISVSQLCEDSQLYTPLLNDILSVLIEGMYRKQLSGIFLILADSSDITSRDKKLPGLYLRDRDPRTMPSVVMEDILVQRGPHGVVQSGKLSTDIDWVPMFSIEDSLERDYFKPYHTARADGARLEMKKYGYWTSVPYILSGDNSTAISYSIPLILNDGTVYGILGVELLREYISELLPSDELHSATSAESTYMLTVSRNGTDLEPVVVSGSALDWRAVLTEHEEVRIFSDNGRDYYAHAVPLNLYDRNAPFETERWYLLGCVPGTNIYGFSEQLMTRLTYSVLATLIFGVLGILLVSYRMSNSIKKLSGAVVEMRRRQKIYQLPDTYILEIDRLVDSVTEASQEVLDISTRLLSIMDMASVELAGFEIRDDSENLFVSQNFFPMFGIKDVDISQLTVKEFIQLRNLLTERLEHAQEADGSILYTVHTEDNGVRYIRAEQTRLNNRWIGLIEDVTLSVMERKRAESERDYDAMTGLLNRQGFSRKADRLFLKRDELKCGALLMLDLDKLKTVNDTFGHSAGDSYIITAGNCFRQNTRERNLCARVAGDEFMIFYYGYEDKSHIMREIKQLFQQIHSSSFYLPDGSNYGISASGGIAWYPDDSSEMHELTRYADFAMYGSKRLDRGLVTEFNMGEYQEMRLQNQRQKEFFQLLDEQMLQYHFQPIFSAKNGQPFAYEALMRVNMPNLQSPLMVLELARKTGRIQEIETLTMFCATEAFEKLVADAAVASDALLFINSISDTSMSAENEKIYRQRFSDMISRTVLELTETEALDMTLLRQKCAAGDFCGMLALDDYGSGYNTELNLLELNPNFIKVDMAIIRNIHLDENKQQLVKNIISYAHARGMRIIAEGLECAEELETCLRLGVDLLQGYYLARPAQIPASISEEACALICSWQHENEKMNSMNSRSTHRS